MNKEDELTKIDIQLSDIEDRLRNNYIESVDLNLERMYLNKEYKKLETKKQEFLIEE